MSGTMLTSPPPPFPGDRANLPGLEGFVESRHPAPFPPPRPSGASLTPLDQFHVDNLSSAHVYLRLRDGEQWDNIPQPLLEDCAQLTKANSIEGRPEMIETEALGSKRPRLTFG